MKRPAQTSRHLGLLAAALLLLLLLTPIAMAAPGGDKPSPPAATPPASSAAAPPPAYVETRHTIMLGQRALDYRALAETITLHDQKGAPTATIFTISYLADVKPGTARPIAFVFNGGPGAASVFLHLGAVGPQIMETPANGAIPDPPVQLVDNPSTWLAFTDLVFIDPVGTGFSRGEGKDDNPSKPFWNVRSDLDSLGSVVRLWLTKHGRWGSPTYLVGESYGGFRAAAMAHSLARDEGITVTGLVLVSPALDIAMLSPDVAAQVTAAVALPSYAATTAVFSGNGAFDPAAVEQFALSDYLVGLAQMKGVPPPDDPFIAKVAAMIGLSVDIVRRERGWVSNGVFTHELRRDRNQVLSPYDATIARPSPGNPWDNSASDPVLDRGIAAFTAAFNAYAPDALGYHTELPYRVLPHEVSRQWGWDAARHGEGGLGLALSGLQAALLDQPSTKVLVAHGRYDLVTPYFASRWLIDQMTLPAPVREAIRLKVYDGGHMMYTRPQSRAALAADVAALFAAKSP